MHTSVSAKLTVDKIFWTGESATKTGLYKEYHKAMGTSVSTWQKISPDRRSQRPSQWGL